MSRHRGRARLTAFDRVKLELAFAVFVLVGAAFVSLALDLSPAWELAFLAVVGLVCGIWIGARAGAVFRILRARMEERP